LNKTLLNKAYDSIFTPEENYIQTGYEDLDSLLSRCTKGSIITIGGRPGMGKTAFSMNVLEQFLTQGKKCLYFSYNISADRFMQRLIFQKAEVPIHKINLIEYLTDEDLKNLSNAKNTIENWDLHICNEALTDAACIDNLIKKIKPDYVFIDAIQDIWIEKLTIRHFTRRLKKLLKNTKLNSEEVNIIHKILDWLPISREYTVSHKTTDICIEKIHEYFSNIDFPYYYEYYNPFIEIYPENIVMDYIAKYLKIIAKKYDIVIFVNSELKKAPEFRKSYYPKLNDLDAPQSLAKASDIVMMLYRKEYYNPDVEENEKNIMEVHFVKPFNLQIDFSFKNLNIRNHRISN